MRKDEIDSLASLIPFASERELTKLEKLLGADTADQRCPHRPTERQAAFLGVWHREALYGGAAGGGKSDALLMDAVQFVDDPGYRALMLRRTYADLSLPGALMDRAKSWWMGCAHWDEKTKTFRWESGASITFGYLESEVDKYRYQGAEFQRIYFDELTQFTETQYTYLFSRLRRRAGSTAPLGMRAASNPGGMGHTWVRDRFVSDEAAEKLRLGQYAAKTYEQDGRAFVPSRLHDNPHLDIAEYEQSLEGLDPVTKAQLKMGDWTATAAGMFRREWLKFIEPGLADAMVDGKKFSGVVRYWDKAGTAEGGDFSAGVLMGLSDAGQFYILDVIRGQWSSLKRNEVIQEAAAQDQAAHGHKLRIWIEQEGGSGGKESAEISVRELAGYNVQTEPVTRTQGNVQNRSAKEVRASPMACQFEAGNVFIVNRPTMVRALIDELLLFPHNCAHDDQVDACSGAFNKLAKPRKKPGVIIV